MADRIIVDSAELQQCANEYQGALNTVLDAVQLYVGALQALASDYTGAAAVIMSGKVLDLTAKITAAAGRCTDAISELRQTQTIFEEGEARIANRANQADAGAASPFQG